jgi:hypothetical protein
VTQTTPQALFRRQSMKQRVSHSPRLRLGLTLVACGLAAGTASVVALANAMYDIVR